ncbi:MAG: DUF502 domain-containing protein [Kiritimatiellae bacterium]|nr:DUF502 domain-containing protein [Kiritimatiellia bacterium]
MSRILKSVRSSILVGLILVTPIVVTAFVVNWLFTFITNRILILLPKHLREGDQELLWRFVALLLVLVLMFFIGLLARNILGRRIYKLGDTVVSRIPIVNRVYITIRQIITSLFQQRKTLFQQAVLVEYPRTGAYTVGFITAILPAQHCAQVASAKPGEECVAVFIPTTPNPTSGWLAIVPRSATQPLAMTSGEAMQLVMSGGAVFPGTAVKDSSISLLELVHELNRSDSDHSEDPSPPTSDTPKP